MKNFIKCLIILIVFLLVEFEIGFLFINLIEKLFY